MQPITPVPVGRYRGKVSGVPLTGGQAQAIVGASVPGSGSVTSPVAFNVIASATVAVSGTYTLNWTVSLSGTVGAGDANNFNLIQVPAVLAHSVNAGAAGSYVQSPVTIFATAGTVIQVQSIGAGTVGATYSATFSLVPVVTLSVGPQGLGTIWYPVQATLSTTTGPLDTSTALVYLGAQGIPITLVGTVYTGNGTVALAIPPMSPGQALIASWTGAHPGDTVAFNAIGTMDALTTG